MWTQPSRFERNYEVCSRCVCRQRCYQQMVQQCAGCVSSSLCFQKCFLLSLLPALWDVFLTQEQRWGEILLLFYFNYCLQYSTCLLIWIPAHNAKLHCLCYRQSCGSICYIKLNSRLWVMKENTHRQNMGKTPLRMQWDHLHSITFFCTTELNFQRDLRRNVLFQTWSKNHLAVGSISVYRTTHLFCYELICFISILWV